MPTTPRPASAGAAVTPPTRVRGDACPGSLRLHSADDGALARIRLPGGVLTPTQADALLTAALRLGDGELHLTSRGNVQLRGLAAGCGGELAALLEDAGLLPSAAHERVRNIVASPLAGLDGQGADGVRGWLTALDAALCSSARATALSGRFLFALDDGRGDVDALGADVTLMALWEGPVAAPDPLADAPAATAEGRTGATARIGAAAGLRIGDADEMVLLRDPSDGPRAALLSAESFLDAVDHHRERRRDRGQGRDPGATAGSGVWRVRELPDRGARLLDLVVARLRGEGIAIVGRERRPRREAIPAAYGVVARPTALGALADGISSPSSVRALRSAISVGAPLGRLTAPQWRRLTDVARGTPEGELRLTPWRGVVVTAIPAEHTGARLAEVAGSGLLTTPTSPWAGVGACIGLPGCAKSHADVRGAAHSVVSLPHSVVSLPHSVVSPPRPAAPAEPTADPQTLPVYWSGCERRCGHPTGDWVDVLATPDGTFQVNTVRAAAHPLPTGTGPAPPPGTADPEALAQAVAEARHRR